jgi:hypothetical protein
MATPHVAGIVATLISRDGNVSPAEMEAKLKSLSVKGAITGLRTCHFFGTCLFSDLRANTAGGTENNLAYLAPVVA